MSTDWAAVYRSTYQELYRFLCRTVWDEDRAKDLAQEAFARALGEDPDNPRALVYQVAKNLARDEARLVVRRKRHLALLRRDAEVETSSSSTPATELERRQKAGRLRQALESLSDRDRDIILLWDAGLNYDEIAAHTGLARGAVGTTLARAKRRLVDAHEGLESEDAALG